MEAERIIPKYMNVKIIANCTEPFLSPVYLLSQQEQEIKSTQTNKRGQQAAQRNRTENETGKKTNMGLESMAVAAELRRLRKKQRKQQEPGACDCQIRET
jgi:hypothetical protein